MRSDSAYEKRGGAVVARVAHNHEITGSSPVPAIGIIIAIIIAIIINDIKEEKRDERGGAMSAQEPGAAQEPHGRLFIGDVLLREVGELKVRVVELERLFAFQEEKTERLYEILATQHDRVADLELFSRLVESQRGTQDDSG